MRRLNTYIFTKQLHFHSEAHITCTYGTSCTIPRLCKHIRTTTNHLYGCRTIKCTRRVSALVDGRKNTSPSFSGSDHIRNIQLMAEQLNFGRILTLVFCALVDISTRPGWISSTINLFSSDWETLWNCLLNGQPLWVLQIANICIICKAMYTAG